MYGKGRLRSNELVLVFRHRDLLWKFIRLQCICSEIHKNTTKESVRPYFFATFNIK